MGMPEQVSLKTVWSLPNEVQINFFQQIYFLSYFSCYVERRLKLSNGDDWKPEKKKTNFKIPQSEFHRLARYLPAKEAQYIYLLEIKCFISIYMIRPHTGSWKVGSIS